MSGTEPLAKDLYRYLVDHLYSKPAAERRSMHWVMDEEWWAECKKTGVEPAPARATMMLGLPVTVKDDGGIPHLERLAARCLDGLREAAVLRRRLLHS